MLLNLSAVMMMIQVFLCKIIPAVRVIAPNVKGCKLIATPRVRWLCCQLRCNVSTLN